VSQFLNKSPFDQDLLNHNEAQLDFILEMYSLDHPKEFRFTRGGLTSAERGNTSKAAWVNVLTGSALEEYLADKGSRAVQAAMRRAAVHSPGVVKLGKKPVENPNAVI
jgi:hypothetical protein